MAFDFREGFWGLQHLRLAVCRRLFKMKADFYMGRFAGLPDKVEICCDSAGKPLLCERCGFVIMRAELKSGWHMEMCSALPLLDLANPRFHSWSEALAAGAAGGKAPEDLGEKAVDSALGKRMS